MMATIGRRLSRVALFLMLVALPAASAWAQGTPVVLPGYEGTAVGKAAVVFRNFGGDSDNTGHDVYLGGPMGSGEEPTPSNKLRLLDVWPSRSRVTFRYDGSSTVYTSIADGSVLLGEVAYTVGNLHPINYIRISFRRESGTVDLVSVKLDSSELPDIPGPTGTATFRNWHIKGIDLSAGFTIEGDIVLSGPQPTEGKNRVVIEVGYLADTSYVFDGFYEPITMGVTNVAKAGQAVPAKWRLMDGSGAPVSSAASFVGLYSYPIACDTLSGVPTDAVEEASAGTSGLQYIGDGYWQFNWKTQKSYANTCRAMYVEFDSGITSPLVNVRLR